MTDEMLMPLLEGLNIQQALDQKRLFVCDLKILDGLPVRPNFVVSTCALCPVPCDLCPVPCDLCPVPCALCPGVDCQGD